MPRKPLFTPEEAKELSRLYASGVPIKTLVTSYSEALPDRKGINYATIRNTIRRADPSLFEKRPHSPKSEVIKNTSGDGSVRLTTKSPVTFSTTPLMDVFDFALRAYYNVCEYSAPAGTDPTEYGIQKLQEYSDKNK